MKKGVENRKIEHVITPEEMNNFQCREHDIYLENIMDKKDSVQFVIINKMINEVKSLKSENLLISQKLDVLIMKQDESTKQFIKILERKNEGIELDSIKKNGNLAQSSTLKVTR